MITDVIAKCRISNNQDIGLPVDDLRLNPPEPLWSEAVRQGASPTKHSRHIGDNPRKTGRRCDGVVADPGLVARDEFEGWDLSAPSLRIRVCSTPHGLPGYVGKKRTAPKIVSVSAWMRSIRFQVGTRGRARSRLSDYVVR